IKHSQEKVGGSNLKGWVVGRAVAGDIVALELARDGLFVDGLNFTGGCAGAVFPTDFGAFAHGEGEEVT
nr:hypothetical protein [Tanacetum cinerariifolium]